MDPTISCVARGIEPACRHCAAGWAQDCLNLGAKTLTPGLSLGYTSGLGGGWAEQVVGHASMLHPLPDAVPDAAASLHEPISIAVHGLMRQPPRERDAYIARYSERDPALRRNRARLRAELEHMRAHGSGITIDEITPGVWACAAPIVEHGKVVAALSVAGPAFRIGKAKRSAFEALVRNAAREVSAGIENRHGVT